MGYNLISVLKQIAANIGSVVVPDPNTQLSNIKTAIDNINIQAIATDSIAVNGSRWNPAGNYVADLNLFWEGIGHVNTSTLNHPQSNGHGIVIAARNGAGAIQIYIPIDAYTDNTDPTIYMRFTQYADLGNWVNPWDYLYLDSFYSKYNDPNNLGVNNVSGAIDKLSGYSDGQATINTAYLSGALYWQKIGKLVSVFYEFQTIANMPGTGWDTWLFANLPEIRVFTNSVRRFTAVSIDPTKPPLTLAATNIGGNYNNNTLYSWGNGGITSGGSYRGNFEYFTF